jgi:signal transduction histidine kinase
MGAITRLHYAQIVGQLERRRKDGTAEIQLSIEWDDGQTVRHKYEVKNCAVESISFEIRIYHLIHRQRMGIPVEDARGYLNEYGGVHIYDAGFRLPYYGYAHDWLDVEMAHAHRLSRADLLPDELQVAGGMEYLPTKSRMLGVVNLDTGFERERARRSGSYSKNDYLQIQITRDRLVENSAYKSVYEIVRWAVEFYATREKLRVFEDKRLTEHSEAARDKFERVEQLIEAVQSQLEPRTYQELQKKVREAVMAVDDETEERLSQSNLLGTLATAGISALAFQHELNKQFRQLEAHATDLEQLDIREAGAKAKLDRIASALTEWLDMARSLRTLFLNVADRDNRDRRAPLRARAVVEAVKRQTALLLRGIPVNYEEVDPELRLPFGAFGEWSAILQNVFLNAANAMLESTKREIKVSSRVSGKTIALLVQDTGVGVDLKSADQLFTPFVRKLKLSREREEMGYGGMGLGLTIVRMLAANLGCKVAFVDPEPRFKTAFRLSWGSAHDGTAQPQIEDGNPNKLKDRQ